MNTVTVVKWIYWIKLFKVKIINRWKYDYKTKIYPYRVVFLSKNILKLTPWLYGKKIHPPESYDKISLVQCYMVCTGLVLWWNGVSYSRNRSWLTYIDIRNTLICIDVGKEERGLLNLNNEHLVLIKSE